MQADARVAAPRRSGGNALPIFNLTLRAFRGCRAIYALAVFALVPLLFGAIYAINSNDTTHRDFMNDLFQNLIAPTILPLAVLTLATSALGSEIEDRTMVYLVLKPIPRWRIILEKFLAIVVAETALLWLGTLLTWLIVMRGDAGDNLDMLAALEIGVLVGVLGYGALFELISLLISRALLAGVMYALLWETSFSRFIPGVRLVSVRHYVLSIYGRILDEPLYLVDEAMQLGSAVITVIVLVVVALALATWRLRVMNLE